MHVTDPVVTDTAAGGATCYFVTDVIITDTRATVSSDRHCTVRGINCCFITDKHVTDTAVTDTVQQEAPLGVLLQT